MFDVEKLQRLLITAERGSKALDDGIYELVNGSSPYFRASGYSKDRSVTKRATVPPYTTSMDSALSLIKTFLVEKKAEAKHYDYILEHVNGGLTISCRIGPDQPPMFGETDELAVCAAFVNCWICKQQQDKSKRH
jgi:hypothetical protein